MKIKVLILSDDEKLCALLKKNVDFSRYQMEACDWGKSDENLPEWLTGKEPALAILDEGTPPAAGQILTLVRQIREKDPACRILVTGAGTEAFLLYGLLQEQVDAYVRRGAEEQQFLADLDRHLLRISRQIRRVTDEAFDFDTEISMQSVYFEELMFDEEDLVQNLQFVNRTLGSRFREGNFRVALFEVDEEHGEIPDFKKAKYYDDLHAVQGYMKRIISDHLYVLCYDMIFDFRFNGILAVFNYDPEQEEAFQQQIREIGEALHLYVTKNYGMEVTIGVGGACMRLSEVQKSRSEAFGAAWMRMKDGGDRVLFYRKRYDTQQLYQKQLENVVEKLKLSAETLNVDIFHQAVDQLFSLPDYVLLDDKSRQLILEFVDEFFEINREELSQYMKPEPAKEDIRKTLTFSTTLPACRQNFVLQFDRLFQLLSADMEKENLRLIRKALKYIKANYDKPLTAEILADQVNLSPVYFSSLFKKSVGVNMTDYITRYRMEKAEDLLLNTEKSIQEVAASVGYQDQRYFSKRFKAVTGVTPTRYRKQK